MESLSTHETISTLERRASTSAASPDARVLPFMLRFSACLSLVIGAFCTMLFISELANGNASEAPAPATIAGVCILTSLLLFTLAALLRWAQLIEWRLHSVGEQQHNR